MTIGKSLFSIFAREGEWQLSTYKSGKNRRKPCMRHSGTDKVRPLTPEETLKHLPEKAYNLDDPMERRVLADWYEDRGEKGDLQKAEHHRDEARLIDVGNVLGAAMHQMQLHLPRPEGEPFAPFSSTAFIRSVRAADLLAMIKQRDPSVRLLEFLTAVNRARQKHRLHVYVEGQMRSWLEVGEEQRLGAEHVIRPAPYGDFDPHKHVRKSVLQNALHLDAGGDPVSSRDLYDRVRGDYGGLSPEEFRHHLEWLRDNGTVWLHPDPLVPGPNPENPHVQLTHGALAQARIYALEDAAKGRKDEP